MNREEAAGILGLPENVARSDILHAYSRAARLTHPDLLPDPTPDAVRAASERFIRLTLARDLLLATSPPASPASAPMQPGGDDSPTQRVEDDWLPTKRPREPHGMGSSIAAVIALAIVLVAVVSLQDSWRAQFGVVGRDLTAGTTVVAVLPDGSGRERDCPGAGPCVLLDVTPDEDCAEAVARFRVTSGTEESTATRELADLRAGRPAEVALAGTAARLLYLGCDP